MPRTTPLGPPTGVMASGTQARVRGWKHEPGRHHSDDRVGFFIELDGLANDVVASAEPLLPKTEAKNDGAGLIRCSLVSREQPTQERRRFQDREQAWRDWHHDNTLCARIRGGLIQWLPA
jgi:hypothetical protein